MFRPDIYVVFFKGWLKSCWVLLRQQPVFFVATLNKNFFEPYYRQHWKSGKQFPRNNQRKACNSIPTNHRWFQSQGSQGSSWESWLELTSGGLETRVALRFESLKNGFFTNNCGYIIIHWVCCQKHWFNLESCRWIKAPTHTTKIVMSIFALWTTVLAGRGRLQLNTCNFCVRTRLRKNSKYKTQSPKHMLSHSHRVPNKETKHVISD